METQNVQEQNPSLFNEIQEAEKDLLRVKKNVLTISSGMSLKDFSNEKIERMWKDFVERMKTN